MSVNPSRRWDRVPVYGVYLRADDTPLAGQIDFALPQRVQRVDGRIIYAEGASVSVTIGDMAQQDATARAVVRAAWRAADQAADGAGFNATAWDTWWDTIIVPAAVFASFPAMDDPDIVHNPDQLASVTVTERIPSGKKYAIRPMIAHLAQPIPGINLGLVDVPPGSPTVPAPIYSKGLPGGVASLDEAGKVPLAQIPDGLGGGGGVSSWDDLEDKPQVIAAGATAQQARDAIGVDGRITALATRNGGGVPRLWWHDGDGEPVDIADGDFVIKPL